MYNLGFIEKNERDYLLMIIFNRGISLYIIDSCLVVYNDDSLLVFKKGIDELCINDVIDILGISISDSKYLYYLIDIASENSFDFNMCKKKSL